MDIDKDFWPCPLAHCGLPLLGPTDERVTIGEITSARANGFKGNRFLYTALVPKEEIPGLPIRLASTFSLVTHPTRMPT
jgi:hypothetical protein